MRADFFRPEAGHRLVEKEQPRLGGERDGNFELAVLAVAEPVDAHVGARLKPDAGERLPRRLAQCRIAPRVFPETERVAGMRLHGERHIVERGEIGKQRGDLERAREPEPAAALDAEMRDVGSVEADAAILRRNLAGQESDQRGLAGAVRADHGVKFAARNFERNGVGRHHAAKALGQALDLQQRLSHGALRQEALRCRRAGKSPPAAMRVR